MASETALVATACRRPAGGLSAGGLPLDVSFFAETYATVFDRFSGREGKVLDDMAGRLSSLGGDASLS